MPGPSHRGDPPPDVPTGVPGEYADAYRTAYEKALREFDPPAAAEASAEDPDGAAEVSAAPAPAPIVGPPPHVGGTPTSAPVPDSSASDSSAPDSSAPDSSAPDSSGATATEYRTRPRWLFPLIIASTALVFIGCAYVLGRMVSGDAGAEAPVQPESKAGSVTPSTSPTPTDAAEPKPQTKPWSGAVAPVKPHQVEVGCTAPDGVDAAGRKVSYRAMQMIDGKVDTAWRCEGNAIGQQIRIALPPGTRVAEVGLIPGYAKTDSRTGADRYAENNRITKVRWTLADGTEVVQSMSANPADRSIRSMRVPATEGDTLTLQILEVSKGRRNTTMISELRVASAK